MPAGPDLLLLNTTRVEAWPSALLRARRSADQRRIARAEWVLRRKRDGRYLGTVSGGRWQPFARDAREALVADAVAAIRALGRERGPRRAAAPLPLDGLRERLARLGIDEGQEAGRGLELVPEPSRLAWAGFDRYGRSLWLEAGAARAWARMRAAAWRDGIVLEAISGYRSHDYQLGIFERKLARGQGLAQILAVNAAPGYSEHHGGQALDLGTPGEAPAEESFERTPAFEWLQRRAAEFGFTLSYPRGNPHGIVYEPWHWRWRA